MSRSWYMSHPNDWKLYPVPEVRHWTMQRKKEQKEEIDAYLLREPSSILCCCKLSHLGLYFQLHVEFGQVNNVLDS
jgi:hypothetical protein